MLVTLSGITIDVKEEQVWNADLPILLTFSPIVTEAKAVHWLNV